MTKPIISTFSQIAPLIIHQYERYLPTAFDEGLSILEKVNKIIKHLDITTDAVNSIIGQWNEVMEWVMNDGLSEAVETKLNAMVVDGTFDTIINQTLFGNFNKTLNAIALTPLNAMGDGVTDDTAAIQTALNTIPVNASAKGLRVILPAGHFKITSLSIPVGVVLEGNYAFDPITKAGTWLYCVDQNNAAVKLNSGTAIKNIGFFYPEQSWESGVGRPLYFYPPSIQIQLDAKRVLIEDICLLNSYYGIDADRHHEFLVIRNVQGYAMKYGLISDYSSDVDRYTTVHFNKNVLAVTGDPNTDNYAKWTRNNGTAFQIKRADWLVGMDLFAWGYRKGLHFTSGINGVPSSVHLYGGGMDACGSDVTIDDGNGIHIHDFFFTCFNELEAGTSTDDAAITIHGGNDIVISNNKFFGVDKGVLNALNDTTQFNNNTIYSFGDYAAALNVDARAIVLNTGKHQITNNVFYGRNNNRNFGVLVNGGADACVITGNTFKDFTQWCIEMNGGNNPTLIGNSFDNCVKTLGLKGTETKYTIVQDGKMKISGSYESKSFFSGYKTSTLTIPTGVQTLVDFDGVDRNDGIISTSNNVDFQVSDDGVYQICVYLQFNDSVTEKIVKVTNFENSNIIAQITSVHNSLVLTFNINLRGGEKFNVYALQLSGNPITLTNTSGTSKLTVTKVA